MQTTIELAEFNAPHFQNLPPAAPAQITYLGRAIDYVKSERGCLVISQILRVRSALVSCPLVVSLGVWFN
ncbi:hypothetical protein PNK_0212 [Candidatus Protochlamydia naegleriophila]|uniref:Uncharacterized protein n=1 Tax=Candidatus Protochlamydia naegleriophila TaxID=389348 RepID=A0A0U5JAJ8_9BACT|nr:hypothetical protein [Candidatus Protochlamydia naegleriophila]CUI15850.1 hypothetical protein PNK_0212 [Candidatus Protochlamydia naegleriophila]